MCRGLICIVLALEFFEVGGVTRLVILSIKFIHSLYISHTQVHYVDNLENMIPKYMFMWLVDVKVCFRHNLTYWFCYHVMLLD